MPNNTTTSPNGTHGGGLGEKRMDVEQGPEWLADLLFNPPEWVAALFSLVVLASLVLAFVGLYRSDWSLDDDVQAEMLANAAIIEGVLLATVLFVWYADYPYLVDAAGGFLLGVAGAYAVIWGARSSSGRRLIAGLGVDVETRERFVAAWMLVAVLGILPMLLAGEGALPIVFRGGLLLTSAGVILTTYNAAVLSNNSDPVHRGTA